MDDDSQALDGACQRFADALKVAGFPSQGHVLNAFSSAYPALKAQADAALSAIGCTPISPEALLAADDVTARLFVGSPDRLFALLTAGYGAVLEGALLAGGAVFPVVRQAARAHGVAMCDMMSDPTFGPYAVRGGDDHTYRVLNGVVARVMRPASEVELPDGMVGELVLADPDDRTVRTGTLSAKEQVPHGQRPAGLCGWMGVVTEALALDGSRTVSASDLAAIIAAHEDVLDARLIEIEKAGSRASSAPVLQVETEAGAWIDDDLRQSFAGRTGVEPRIEHVVPGQFPNTGRALLQRVA